MHYATFFIRWLKRMLPPIGPILFLLLLPCILHAQTAEDWSNLGIYGGQITSIAIDPSNPDKMLAAAYQGDGLYVTTDGGTTWQPVRPLGDEELFIDAQFHSVKIAFTDPDIIWAVANQNIVKSTDGGVTWMELEGENVPKNEDRYCHSLAIDPNDDHIVYVGATGPGEYQNGAVYKTIDGGLTWTKQEQVTYPAGVYDTFDYDVKALAIDPHNSQVIWAATNSWGVGPSEKWPGSHSPFWGTLFRSDDGGQNWEAILAPSLPHGPRMGCMFNAIAVKPDEPNVIFTGNDFGVYKTSFDVALSEWISERILGNWVGGPPPGSQVGGDPLARDVRALAFDPQNPDVLYAAWKDQRFGEPRGQLARGTAPFAFNYEDYGNWEIFITSREFFTLCVYPLNSEILIGGDQGDGIFKSQDHGQTWVPANEGINSAIISDIESDPRRLPGDPVHLLAATSAGVFEKTGDHPWVNITEGKLPPGFPSDWTVSVAFHPTNHDIYFAGLTSLGYVLRSLDRGLTWEVSSSLAHYGRVTDILIIPSSELNRDTVLVTIHIGSTTNGKIFKSIDGGQSYYEVLSSDAYPFNAIAVDPSDDQHLFVGAGCYYSPFCLGGLLESHDSGETWAWTTLQEENVLSVLIDPLRPNIIYAGCNRKNVDDDSVEVPVYKSIDGGLTWLPAINGIPSNQPDNAVMDLKFHYSYPNHSLENQNVIYAATNKQGIYISPNQGKNWVPFSTPTYRVYTIATGSLYAGTEGGLLQLTGTGLISGKITDRPSGTALAESTVFTDMNNMALGLENGEYMMVVPSGTCSVTSIADSHANVTIENVTVRGGDVSWVDISMDTGIADSVLAASPHVDLTDGKDRKCFISTISHGTFLGESLVGYDLFLMLLGVFFLAGIYKRIMNKALVFLFALFLTFLLSFPPIGLPASLFQQVGISSTPNPVGSGARAMGMAGAFIAIADDATAASWNPAGMIQLEKPELSIVGSFDWNQEKFFSQYRPEVDTTGNFDYLYLNYFSATLPFETFQRNMVISVNYQRLYNFERNFSHRQNIAENSLSIITMKDLEQEGSLGPLGLAVAVQVTPQFAFGTTLNLWGAYIPFKNGWEATYSEQGNGTLSGTSVETNTLITESYDDFSGINANFGFLWQPAKKIKVGSVVKLPFRAQLRHEFAFQNQSDYGLPVNSSTNSEYSLKEDVKLDFPLSYGIGVALRFSDSLFFDLDIYGTEWSQYILTDGTGKKFSPIDGRPKEDSDISRTIQVRLGGEYLFIGKKFVIPIRTGFFYDPEPSEGEMKDFYGISLGSGFGYKQVIFDIAYQLRWGNDVDTGNLINSSSSDVVQHNFLSSLICRF